MMSETERDFFYRPKDAWCGDFIPFYNNGEFKLFYLHDWRNKEKFGEGVAWFQISTKDFVNFTEHGEMLPRGKSNEQDLYVGTGSVIKAGDSYHIFYTGINPYFRREGKPEQAVMHAVSKDLLKWEKIPEDIFYAREDIYEPHDWRDPYVFWNEKAKEYWMLLAARLKEGPSRRRGCTALCVSKDLIKWQARGPFWAPSLYYTHECPDLFKIGKWFYLVYSTFTERNVTHYRMSKSLAGPWLAPENDTFDGRAYYAAKTCSDGRQRFLFGWNPTKEGEKDYDKWQWGGNLVVHEIIQESDGSLSVSVPKTIDKTFFRDVQVLFSPGIGKWKINKKSVSVSAPDSFACAIAREMPKRCKIFLKVTFGEGTHSCGVILRMSEDMENAYYIRLEPGRNRLVFDSWPRSGDIPFMVELERPLELFPGRPYELKVFVDSTVCEVYVGRKTAMSARLYNLNKGTWGVFVDEGSAKFNDYKTLVR